MQTWQKYKQGHPSPSLLRLADWPGTGEKVCGVSVISRRYAPEVLQAAEHPFDGVSPSIKERREAVLPLAVGLGRDVGDRAALLDLGADRVRVVTLVRVQDLAGRKPRQKFRAGCAINDLAAGECERERTALCVRQRMDFGRPPAARASNRLAFLPPFPPAAERWAFTAELSIKTCSVGLQPVTCH